MTGGYQTSCGDHFVRYIKVRSLCCTPETNIILYVSCTFIEKNFTLQNEKEKKKIGKFGNQKFQHFGCKENEINMVRFCKVKIGM